MSKVFCLILNYNRPQDTIKCAESLLKSDLPAGTGIIIIDNGPMNRKKYFSTHVPTAIYLKSPGNIGFSAANNLGIKYALSHAATHILIINPDVTVPRRFLSGLLDTFKVTPRRVGLVAPAHTEGRGNYGLGGTMDWRWCTFPHENVIQLPKSPRRYDLLTFACVLIKREVFETVGLLDERYFLYLEDVDYCVSAAKAGFLLYLNPSVVINHQTSSSFTDPRAKIWYSLRSCLIFIRKWYSFPHNILPILHTLHFYPSLYVLWTLKRWVRKYRSNKV
jgi:hypothetical protein